MSKGENSCKGGARPSSSKLPTYVGARHLMQYFSILPADTMTSTCDEDLLYAIAALGQCESLLWKGGSLPFEVLVQSCSERSTFLSKDSLI